MTWINSYRLSALLLLAGLALVLPGPALAKQCPDLLDVDVRALNDNRMVNLCEDYKGKVILVVNTASKCGYTGQYAELEKLYEDYHDAGLVVLGFPSNDFGGQEPGTEKQIQDFCVNTYAVRFPMFQKTRVKANNADPLYRMLGDKAGYPRWNFHKYLIDRQGQLVEDYASRVSPLSKTILADIRQLLDQ